MTEQVPVNISSKGIEYISLEDQARAMQVATRVDSANLFPGVCVRHILNRVHFVKGSAPKWSAEVHHIKLRKGG